MTTTAQPAVELLRTDEVAALLRISIRTVWRLIERDELPAVKVGAQWRIPADALNERLDLEPSAAAARPTTNSRRP